MSAVTVVVLLTIYALNRYLRRNFHYWTVRGVAGPVPVPLLGTMWYKFSRPLNELDVEWQNRYGKIYGTYLGSEPVLNVAEPSLIRQILVSDFSNFVDRRHLATEHPIINLNLFFVLGEKWRRIRSLVSPALSNSKIRTMHPPMRECVEGVIDFVNAAIKEQHPTTIELDVKVLLGNLTMDVIARTVFATKIHSNIDRNNAFVVNARQFFDIKWYRYFPAFWLPKCLLRLLMSSQFKESTNQFFIGISRHLLHTRRRERGRHPDLVQFLADARHKETGNDQLSDEEILAQCWVIFLAGYETTASTLSYALAELAQNPHIQDRLAEEIRASAQYSTNSGQFSFESLRNLEYLDAVLCETLRKYPPIVRLERTCSRDFPIHEDLVLRAGQVVEIPVYAIHHDPNNFPEPEMFDPSRFLERRSEIPSNVYLPFGDGPRNCVGAQFALMELKLALSMLVNKFRFISSENTSFPLRFEPVTPFLYHKNNILRVEHRV